MLLSPKLTIMFLITMAKRKMRTINIKKLITAVFYNVALGAIINYCIKKLNFISQHLIIDTLKVHD